MCIIIAEDWRWCKGRCAGRDKERSESHNLTYLGSEGGLNSTHKRNRAPKPVRNKEQGTGTLLRALRGLEARVGGDNGGVLVGERAGSGRRC